MNELLLELSQVTKDFEIGKSRLPVLKGIEITVSAGEAVAMMGPSGAGKTTALNIAGGLMRPTAGSVKVMGQELFDLNDEALSRVRNRHIGFVFQLHHLLPEFTAEENVALPALITGETKRVALVKAQSLLELVGLESRKRHKPGELSGGEQQRVVIARALINRPRLLLADEPTGDLDGATATEIHRLLIRLNKEQKQTLLLVTHNPELAGLVDRVVRMKDGLLAEEEG